jgi:predicted MFS family arabinose efflux permease
MSNVVSTPAGNATTSGRLSTWYANYVLGLLFVTYCLNTIDRAPILGVSLQAIKREFGATDAQLGLLSGLPFALFYATLGVPIAWLADRMHRPRVVAMALATWSLMTAFCGLASSWGMLLVSRIGTAVGESGGSPPSHSLIADYFPESRRGLAFSVIALAVPFSTAVGSVVAGYLVDTVGWRLTFFVVGTPGLLLAALIATTLREPTQFLPTRSSAPLSEQLTVAWSPIAFRYLTLATGMHAIMWYANASFSAAFLMRSHGLSAASAGRWLSAFSLAGAVGTFGGGYICDRVGHVRQDLRWSMWIPAAATLLAVPFQFPAYLVNSETIAFSCFAIMMMLSAVFFAPSFAVTQILAAPSCRATATSLLLFVQTLVGYGLGPLLAGALSDRLQDRLGRESLRYALATIGLFNVLAFVHYVIGARYMSRYGRR